MIKVFIAVIFLSVSGVVNSAAAQTAMPNATLFAPNVISTEFMETSAAFTPDGKKVYFTRSDVQFSDNTIMESTLKNGRWTEPVVASFSGVWRDSESFVSPDGLTGESEKFFNEYPSMIITFTTATLYYSD